MNIFASETETEAHLGETLRAEAYLTEDRDIAAEIYLRAERRDLECEVALGVVVAMPGLQVAYVGAKTHMAIELDNAVTPVFISGVEHDHMICYVAGIVATLGSA